MPISGTLIDGLFGGTLSILTDQRSALSQAAISMASDRVVAKDYEGAVTQLKRAIALDPRGSYASQAWDLLGQAYEQLDRPDDAIKAYKAVSTLDPTLDSPYVRLGKLYYGEKKFAESERAYAQAVRLSPTSTTNLLSLGQAQMANGKPVDAETSFRKVVQLAPNEYGSHYSLGQVLAKGGKYEEAIAQFERTLELDHSFDTARVDLGQAFVALGRFDEAKAQLAMLRTAGSAAATVLEGSITQATKPELKAAYSLDGFSTGFGAATPVSYLDPDLATAGAVKEFSLTFYFSKPMDEASVENPTKWSINRTALGSRSGAYNNNKPVPATEAGISPVPNRVVYDSAQKTAQVYFTVRQNDGASATIDPSHIIFRFAGLDAYGTAMDSQADEYNSISGIG